VPPKVMEYMTTPPHTVLENDNLAHARNMLLRHKVGRLLVLNENGELVGIVTDTDFVKIYEHPELIGKSLDELFVRDIMSRNPVTITPTESIVDAARIMYKHSIGTLPVVEDEKVVGIITRTDVVRAYGEKYPGRAVVNDVMDPDPPVVTPYHSLNHVIDKMNEKPYYKVIVTDGGRPLGVIAKRDIIFIDPRRLSSETKYIKRNEPLPKGRTGGVRYYLVPLAIDVMTPNPITTTPEEDLAKAATTIVKNRIGCLPVVDRNGLLQGIITKHEIIEYIARSL
jgi:CBS domain-containing protein